MNKFMLAVITVLMLLAFAGCATKEETGTFAGGAAGAAIGHGLGGGTVGTVLGALGGAYLGREAGKYLDNRDREQVADTLENQETGQAKSWTNPDTGKHYKVTPTETFTKDGQPCRRFTMDVEGEQEDVTGTACRTAGGDWQIVG